MKKRLLCFAMCIIMVLSMFILSGCSDKEETDEETEATTATTSTKAMTFVMTGIKGRSTTDEAVALVEAAINNITHSEYNTNIILRLYEEDEYDAEIEKILTAIEEQKIKEAEEAAAKKAAEKAAREAAKAAAAAGETTTAATTTAAEETTSDGDETIINEYGFEQTLYPEEKGVQLDIVLIRNFDQFTDYQERGVLTALDEQLSIGSKILKQYIHPTFLSAAQVGGRTYAIPNNHVIGEYEYLLVNKELYDKYYYDPDAINDFSDINEFLLDVIKYEPDYIPMLNEPEQRVEYFSDNPSIIGSYVSKTSALGVSAAPKNLISVSQYMTLYKMVNNLKAQNAFAYDGYIGDGNNYAAAIVKGDYTTPMLYEDDYYVSVYKYPTATNENVYSGMYAVTTTAADVARCMQIISALSTNEELINLYTYGVEGVHYEIDEFTGMVTKLNNDYSVNSAYTGNQFLMWQSSDMDELTLKNSANKWEYGKAQNLDMVYSGYLGYVMPYTTEEKDEDGNLKVVDIIVNAETENEMTMKELVAGIERVSQDYLNQIASFEEYDYEEETIKPVRKVYADGTSEIVERSEFVTKTKTVDDFISDLLKEIAEDVYIAAAINAADENSPVSLYSAWHTSKYPPAA